MNKTQVVALLMSNPRAVELALLGLLSRQTSTEQHTSTTIESNGRGFNYRHANFGTSLAKWVKEGRRLTSRQLSAARPIVCHYWRQVRTMPEVVALVPPPAPKTYRLYGEEELCVAITQWDRFQQFPGVTQHQ
jgi:hypothetical protein